MMIMQKKIYVSILRNLILCAILIVGFAGDCSATAVNNSSGKSDLKVALLDAGSIGDHGWVFEGT